MILSKTGNILEAQTDALVIPCNAVGVMGAGLALQYKNMYPEGFITYYNHCKNPDNELRAGDASAFLINGKWHIFAYTKGHWREDSYLSSVTSIARRLRSFLAHLDNCNSIAIPAIGCGLGMLDWRDVKDILIDTLEEFADTEDKVIELYEPRDTWLNRS